MKQNYCSLDPLISFYQLERPINWELQFQRRGPLVVEIGFGQGEVLVRSAKELPNNNYIGIEQHWERIQKTLRAITRTGKLDPKAQINNIKILKIDARVAFEKFFDSKSIDYIYSLFPCPWPKKEHIKHRLFSNSFLKLLNNRLKDEGLLRIVTDFEPYFEWVQEQAQESGFFIEKEIINPQFDTKFERKWRAEGQNKFFEIRLKKNKHFQQIVEKDVELKTYKLKDFNPESIRLEDETTDEVAIVFKQMLFDPKTQKAMILSVVVEKHLTQHFWVAITKKDDFWRIYKADGQHFFPTPGIARTLELVYQAAVKK